MENITNQILPLSQQQRIAAQQNAEQAVITLLGKKPTRPPFDYRVHGLKETFWTPEGAYRALWQSINKKKGVRWQDNPDVWVIEFELVR